jgi:predicted nucleic acid-binding Zn ribbon protein
MQTFTNAKTKTCNVCSTPIVANRWFCKPCGIEYRRLHAIPQIKPTKTCANCGKLFVSVRGRKTCNYCR